VAEKDIWEVAKRIARERKRREIEPVKQVLERLQAVEGDPDRPEVREFTERMAQLNGFVGKMDSSFDTLLRADESWFFSTLLKLMK
jgi:DNA-binding transcriptional regulator GbsR (MarR family)